MCNLRKFLFIIKLASTFVPTSFWDPQYSAEYQIYDFPPYEGKYDYDVPCAVCNTINRGKVMMIPARMSCPSGWTIEYYGYLMSDDYDLPTSREFVCVDRIS